ncbi:MAG: glutamine amidotransferase [Kaiparowitsia implicata GSE-PSE-MK54-09C]|jgi:GMP synthase (glutamine-hydrolysing)|nr:glutamine amidotransferase [Kaiparowitsia implicata GSE-PSE-MK54-09C]
MQSAVTPSDASSTPKVLVVVHQATSNPGLVGHLLRQHGCDLDIRCPAVGEDLPASMDHHSGTVVFGGPMSANDDGTLPFIRQELTWIEQMLTSGKPYLGICLGGQLLARVLGAAVTPHPDGIMEIGYVPIHPQVEVAPELAELRQVFQWHREGFDIPTGGTRLAQGKTFMNQAFRYGAAAYGLQFHPEITAAMIQEWTVRGAEFLKRPEAPSPAQQLTQHQAYGESVNSWLNQFLQHWLSATA